jgi:formate-nitrite transporter family protein
MKEAEQRKAVEDQEWEERSLSFSAEEGPPFKPYRMIFDQETAQAVEELQRPAIGLFISGLMAGSGVAVSILLLGVLLTHLGGELHELWRMVLIANAYAVGLILVIMARTDLFTEYSTIAIFPVLTKQAPIRALVRLWGIIYAANLIGGTAFALLLSGVGPSLGIIKADTYVGVAFNLVGHPWYIVLGSAFLTGWLMGLLSWLVIAAKESISQIFFIWLIAGVIGFAHLHHAIVGAIEVLLGVIESDALFLSHFGHFLLWTTLGNIAGGLIFAVLIRYSVLLHKREHTGKGPNQKTD